MNTKKNRALAAVGVAAVATVSIFGAAATAGAQGAGNIDPAESGSLTVHKYLHQTGSVEGDITGTPDPAFSDPVAGVQFTAYPLLQNGSALDLGVPASWTALDDLTPGAGCTAPAGFTLGTGVVMPDTNAQGLSTVALPQTAYQVCETDAPANILDRAAPFILTVPMPKDGGWVYNVHAYPKNGAGEITKSIIEQDGLGLGSTVRFPVSSPIPSSVGADLSAYSITDTMDSRLTPNAATNGVSSVTVNGTALDASYYTKSISGQEIIMEFTQAGIDWLNSEDRSGQVIEVTFDTTVNAVGNGVIENTANLWVNNPGRDAATKLPLESNEVSTNWGGIELTKTAADSGDPLADATFQVYNATDPYAADCTAATATGDPIAVDGVTDFTTAGASGTVAIDGLFVSDSVNPSIDDTDRCYVLRETAAPAGYVLPTGAEADTGFAVAIGAATSDNVTITNAQQTGPDLPLTGGAGTGAMVGLGAALVLGGAGIAVAKNRRNERGVATIS